MLVRRTTNESSSTPGDASESDSDDGIPKKPPWRDLIVHYLRNVISVFTGTAAVAVLLHQYPISGWANRHSSPTLSRAAWATFNHQYRTGHDNSHPTRRTMQHRDFITVHPHEQLIQQLINHGEFPYTTRQRERDNAQCATRKSQYSNEHHLLQNVCPQGKTDELDNHFCAGATTATLFTSVNAWRAEMAVTTVKPQGP